MTEKTQNNQISLKSSKKVLSSVVYTLNVPNFLTLPKHTIHTKNSPTFEFANATWYFRFYPNGRPIGCGKKYFDVSIVRMESEVPCHKIFYTITLLDDEGEKYDDVYNVDVFDEDNMEHGVAHFFEHAFLKRSKTKRNRISVTGESLQLVCELFCDESTRETVTSNQDSHSLVANKDVEALCQDLKDLFLNGQTHDLTLKVVDKEFRVHRNILIARSKVFKAMLSHDMIEKKSGVIDIPDCDSQAMEQFLFYVYSGKVETMNSDNVLGLYYAAEKYDMALLKEECIEFIKKSLSPSKICDVFQFALNHTNTDLLNCATEYFVANTSDILLTVEWMAFMKLNSVAANELFLKAAKKWNNTKS